MSFFRNHLICKYSSFSSLRRRGVGGKANRNSSATALSTCSVSGHRCSHTLDAPQGQQNRQAASSRTPVLVVMKVTADATIDEHYAQIRSRGESYLARALKHDASPKMRQRVLMASLKYLEERAKVSLRSGQASQASQGAVLSQSLSVARHDSGLQSLLAGALDQDMATDVLIEACAKAADCQLLPILVKCLFILANAGSINAEKPPTHEDVVMSPSQYDDDELFGPEESDAENVNAQNVPLQTREGAPKQKVCGKRAAPSSEVKVGRTGQSFVDEFISRLVTCETGSSHARSNAVFVSTLAKEAPLSQSAARNVLRLLTRRMRNVDIFELPAFIYQLLLFASAHGDSGVKSQVLLSVTYVFAGLEKNARRADEVSQHMLVDDEDAILSSSITMRELRQVQGTSLLHIEYAARQDPDLSAQIGKLAKCGVENPKYFLTSFGVGIVLSLARLNPTQSDVMNTLREALLRFRREMAERCSNLFVARVCMNDDRVLDPSESLLHVADCTLETGWDQVKESVVNFALVLIDDPLSEDPSVRSGSDVLGEKLLVKLFKAHPAVRERILEQLTTRIALHEKSSQRAINVIQQLSAEGPYDVLEHGRLIRDGIEFLVTLQPWMASALINAYKPLLMTRSDLHDYFQLVIRKSLFHRDSASRAVAISGFLLNASMLNRSGPSASEGCSSTYVTNKDREERIGRLSESLQPLRRVFSYPAPLRALLYKSASYYLHITPSQEVTMMASAISEVMRDHLRSYIDPNEQPYILLEHCVDESKGGVLTEPLGEFIWCMAVAESNRDPVGYAESYIIDLAKKVAAVSLRDFSITKELMMAANGSDHPGIELHSQTAEQVTARANRNRVRVLGSVCEALIHAIMMIPSGGQSWTIVTEGLIPLLTLKGKAFDLLRDAGGSSVSDAFNELGGDMSIERLRPGTRIFLQRSVKGSGSKTVKGKVPRKNKVGESSSIAASTTMQITDHRFGVFSVLASASSKPHLPLETTMRWLQEMTDAACRRKHGKPSLFENQMDTRDSQELRVYLLAIAQKHIDDIVVALSKDSRSLSRGPNASVAVTPQAIMALAKLAMSDFKRFRRSVTNVALQGGIGALHITERCTKAVELLASRRGLSVPSFCRALLLEPAHMEHDDDRTVYESAVDAVEHLVDSLLDDELGRETVVALRIHGSLVRTIISELSEVESISAFLTKRVGWVTDVLYLKQISDSGVVKTLVQTCLTYTENNNDLRRAGLLCQRLLEVIGDCDENAEIPEVENGDDKLCSAEAVQKGTSLAVVEAILDLVEHSISDVDWCLNRMASLEAAIDTTSVEVDSNTCKDRTEEGGHGLREEALSKHAIRAEDAAHVRLEGTVRTLRGLARCAIGKWTQQERLLRLITKTYKLISSATQAQAKRKGDPRTTFLSLVNECKGLAPTLWTYVAFISADSGIGDAGKGTSRAGKEARVMPQLVYEVEHFEKVLIGAQKRTKINLLRGMRRNIARDFRIREDKLCEEDNEENEIANDGAEIHLQSGVNETKRSRH